jgi:hypothetical protein
MHSLEVGNRPVAYILEAVEEEEDVTHLLYYVTYAFGLY